MLARFSFKNHTRSETARIGVPWYTVWASLEANASAYLRHSFGGRSPWWSLAFCSQPFFHVCMFITSSCLIVVNEFNTWGPGDLQPLGLHTKKNLMTPNKPKLHSQNQKLWRLTSHCGLNRHAWSVNWRFLPEAWGRFLSVTPQTQWTHSPFRTTRRNISTAVGLQERCWLLLGMFMSYSGGLGCGIVSRINVSATFDATCWCWVVHFHQYTALHGLWHITPGIEEKSKHWNTWNLLGQNVVFQERFVL